MPARALEAGDVIELDGEELEVVGEPYTVHRGHSLFDEFEVLVGLQLRSLGGQLAMIRRVLRPDELVRRAG
jgi:hypothetical protein